MTKNIQHVWSMLCSGVSIDQNTNNLTLFNTIEQIKISEDKLMRAKNENQLAVPFVFNLVTLWRREDSKYSEKADVEIEVVDPSGAKRKSKSYSLEFATGVRRMRFQIQWSGIKVTTSGTYKFVVSLKGEKDKKFIRAGEAYLDIEILPTSKK